MPINAGKLLLLHKFRKSFAAASPLPGQARAPVQPRCSAILPHCPTVHNL